MPVQFAPNPNSDPEKIGGKYADLLLWFFIWGEAANLRHLPESLAFLYHKCMESWQESLLDASSKTIPSREPGDFMDHTVVPMYMVLKKAMAVKKDHPEKRNYDDFNEFFWTSRCLKCTYTNLQPLNTVGARPQPGHSGGDEDTVMPFVADALKGTPKSFLEKRSWFHLFLNFRRVYEFLIISFQILVCFAFSDSLVWDTNFTVQMLSSVFLTMNGMQIIWTLMLAWVQVPPKTAPALDLAARSGLLLSLAGHYAVFVFQVMYFTWAMDHLKLLDRVEMREHGDDLFWWWQYVWLSLIVLSSYGLESLMQLIPYSMTLFLHIGWPQNTWWASFLHINYPISRLYVAKEVHESLGKALTYQIFWLTMLAWKFVFGYLFLVQPLCNPTIALYDDYMNFPGTSYYLSVVLVLLRWLPAMLVFAIDTSIWYSLWAGVVGVYVGLDEGLGVVKNFKEIRDHFMDLPQHFCSRIISAKALPSVTRTTSTDEKLDALRSGRSRGSKSNRISSSGKGSLGGRKSLPNIKSSLALSDMGAANVGNAKIARNGIRKDADGGDGVTVATQPLVVRETSHLLEMKSLGGSREFLKQYVNEYMESHVMKGRQWVVFAQAWNEIIEAMREGDIVSDAESFILKFNTLPGFAKPVYLPVFQTAGLVENAAAAAAELFNSAQQQQPNEPYEMLSSEERERLCLSQVSAGNAWNEKLARDVCTREAIAEAWELTSWLLRGLLGPTHAEGVDTIVDTINQWLSVDTAANVKGVPGSGAAPSELESSVIDSVPPIFNCLNLSAIDRFRGTVMNLVKILESKMPKRKTGTGSRKTVMNGVASFDGASSASVASSPVSPTSGVTRRASSSFVFFDKINEDSTTTEFLHPSTAQGVPSDDAILKPEEIDTVRDSVRDNLKQLFDAVNLIVKPSAAVAPGHRQAVDNVREALKSIRQCEEGFFWDGDYASKQLDVCKADSQFGKIARKLFRLLAMREVDIEPKSMEAKRRLTFFVNSLFMDMPAAPPVAEMQSFTIMTPFYSEDVIYTKSDLEHENSDGVTVLMYLQTLYKADWQNFLERLGIKDQQQIWSKKYLMETRLWASLRAQTLSRTVYGMMQYEQALRLLASIERDPSEKDMEEILPLKFSYVVAAQVYGKMKKSQDSKADDIEWLLHKYPNLRVAYIDERPTDRSGGAVFSSCLIRSHPDPDNKSIQTVYRVRLPGNPVLGEGKPENQNHAIIFTRGEFIQAIDMNQDGYFEEALKHRNLLQEFSVSDSALPMAILGFREHIFTGSVSSIANYMALQEASFVTTGQRVLNRPLCIRLHYGHPDLFDKLFFMQRGGISKASKGINLSEDVFAGYSVGIRGGSVGFKEYAQVGKGRDVGMQQIYKFEAKLSQGNAEQCLSRDVARLANRLDFPRLLSYFFGGIGHYINSTVTVFTIIFVTYSIAFMALFGFEKIGDRLIVVLGGVQIMLAGMGVLQTLPLLATLTVERGMAGAVAELIRVFGSGGPFYFIFHIQTRAYYFFQTLIAGGAQYRATGRGFVTRHAHFDENWRFFSSSHIYLGIELLGALAVFGLNTKTRQFWGHGWSMFVAAMSFVWTPYWFNPLAFNWSSVSNDYRQWIQWMSSDGGNASHSWTSWWREDKAYISNLRFAEKFVILSRAVLFVVLAFGVTGSANLEAVRLAQFAHFLGYFGACLLGTMYIDYLGCCSSSSMSAAGGGCVPRPTTQTRFLKIPLTMGLIFSCLFFFNKDRFFVNMAFGLYYLMAGVYTVGVVIGVPFVSQLLRVHDYLCGHLMFVPLFVLAALQIPDKIQTWLLYHNALSEGVLIDTILKQARRTQKSELDMHASMTMESNAESIVELKRKLDEQQQVISRLLKNNNASSHIQDVFSSGLPAAELTTVS